MAPHRFRDRVAFVTGAAAGLGRGIALRLAAEGATVIAADIDAAGLSSLATERIAPVALDVRDAAAFRREAEAAAARHGRIDYLFNLAGVAVAGELHSIGGDAWRRVVDVNLMGTAHGIAAVYPLMAQARRGHIVNMASVAGLLPFPLLAPYAATKAAIVSLTESLRLEAEAHGVRVTLVCPGFVETGIYERSEAPAGIAGGRADLVPFKKLPLETAVRIIVDGVARRRRRLVFPAYWRWCWRLYRLHPALLTLGTRALLGRSRAALAEAARVERR